MKKTNFEIQLPFFCGFHESPFYNYDTLYWETHDEENMNWYREHFEDDSLTEDDLDIDFDRYRKDCCKNFIEVFFNSSSCPSFIESIEYSELVSQHYYNFETDKLYANVIFSEDWQDKVKSFMDENKEALAKKIHDDWSDRDGFWSFMANTFDLWDEELQKDEPDVRYIGVIIQYMMKFENEFICDELIDGTLEDFYIGEYIINTKENKK